MKRKVYLTFAFTFALFVSSYASNDIVADESNSIKTEMTTPSVELLSESMMSVSQAKPQQGGGAKKPAAKKPAAKKSAPKSEFMSNFGYGFKAGANFCNLSLDTKMRASYAVGIFGEYYFTDKLGVSLEVMYSEQGGQTYAREQTDGSDGYRERTHLGLNYINVPLFVQYKVMDRLVVKAGFQYGFLTRALWHERDRTRITTSTLDQRYYNVEEYDIAVPVGVTYSFNSGIFVEARYTYGFKDVTIDYEGEGAETFNSNWPDYRNNTIMIGVGYKF